MSVPTSTNCRVFLYSGTAVCWCSSSFRTPTPHTFVTTAGNHSAPASNRPSTLSPTPIRPFFRPSRPPSPAFPLSVSVATLLAVLSIPA